MTASYYKRIQTIFSHGEEDLYNFVARQKIKHSTYIKRLIRNEMLREAGLTPEPTLVDKKEEKIELDDGGIMF